MDNLEHTTRWILSKFRGMYSLSFIYIYKFFVTSQFIDCQDVKVYLKLIG